MIKDIIDNEGYRIDTVFTDENNNILYTNIELNPNEKLIESCDKFDLVKPKWNGSQWIEGATEEEIKKHAFKVENRIL